MTFPREALAAVLSRDTPLRAGLIALGLLHSGVAGATDSTDQCLQAYEAGQRLRQVGDLVGAGEELLVCGGPACPVRMQGDCQRWLDAVERATPAVVFRVRGSKGVLLANVDVSIDGEPSRRLDGRALLMNPGEHVLLFEHEGYEPLHTPVFVTEGEKLEPREVTLQPHFAAPSATESSSTSGVQGDTTPGPELAQSSRWPFVLGGVGLAGAAGFVFFGVRAQSGEADLEQCTPNCSQSRVDDVKRDYLYSNVSLGVGLVGLTAAGLWLLLDDESDGAAAGGARHGLQVGTTTRWVSRF
jgi:hypothetical protein